MGTNRKIGMVNVEKVCFPAPIQGSLHVLFNKFVATGSYKNIKSFGMTVSFFPLKNSLYIARTSFRNDNTYHFWLDLRHEVVHMFNP